MHLTMNPNSAGACLQALQACILDWMVDEAAAA
jgi:hypothetical protein